MPVDLGVCGESRKLSLAGGWRGMTVSTCQTGISPLELRAHTMQFVSLGSLWPSFRPQLRDRFRHLPSCLTGDPVVYQTSSHSWSPVSSSLPLPVPSSLNSTKIGKNNSTVTPAPAVAQCNFPGWDIKLPDTLYCPLSLWETCAVWTGLRDRKTWEDNQIIIWNWTGQMMGNKKNKYYNKPVSLEDLFSTFP